MSGIRPCPFQRFRPYAMLAAMLCLMLCDISAQASAIPQSPDTLNSRLKGWDIRKTNEAEAALLAEFDEIPYETVGGRFKLYGSNSTRYYLWDYFENNGFDNEYDHTGNRTEIGLQWFYNSFRTDVSYQNTSMWNLPTGASKGAGVGAVYRANGGRTQDVNGNFLRKLNLRYRNPADPALALGAGRMDLQSGLLSTDSSESYIWKDGFDLSKTQKMSWIKRQRIAGRMIDIDEWSEFRRAFDGGYVSWSNESVRLYAGFFNPTQGLCNNQGGRSIDGIDLGVVEFTVLKDTWIKDVEMQLFFYDFADSRVSNQTLPRRDNTGSTILTGAEHDIHVNMLGGHLVGVHEVGPGVLDFLVWGGYQSGDWFELDHSAHALALEAGYQSKDLPWHPWLRVGYNTGSGDSDANDSEHRSFYQMLPASQRYSSSTLYNLMNNEDIFVSLLLNPISGVTIQSNIHAVKLEEKADRWYLGSGPLSMNNFTGYNARPSGNSDVLGTMLDMTVIWNITSRIQALAYYGYFSGGSVVKHNFNRDHDNIFSSFEISVEF